jgi:hypothetical protein
MHIVKASLLTIAASIISLGLGAALHDGGVASAASAATVTCALANAGNTECTIQMNANIGVGGTVSATLPTGTSTELTCDALQGGTTCGAQQGTVTISCPDGCSTGGEYEIGVLGDSGPNTATSFNITSTGSVTPAVGPLMPASTPGTDAGSSE